MAPLPKRRHSSARQAKRTRALKQSRVDFIACPQCNSAKLSHHVCPKCGFYDGKEVISIKSRKQTRQ